jgi:adenylosuccinate lyase
VASGAGRVPASIIAGLLNRWLRECQYPLNARTKESAMPLSKLTAVSPIDGRYGAATAPLADYFSEGALIRYRVRIEIEYFLALCRLPLPQLAGFDKSLEPALKAIYQNFSDADARRVKAIEKETNHDVKAVEYFLKERFDHLGLSDSKEFIHFALTSQDINNTATPLALKEAWLTVMRPAIDETIRSVDEKAIEWRAVPMLARTHGQPASPTRLGKELRVFTERIRGQLNLMAHLPWSAKFGGATGNFNAHLAAYPQVDWIAFADHLVNDVLGLDRKPVTTQIEPYDDLAAFCDNVRRINTICIDLCRDIWTYISMAYFKQKIAAGEVGSSAMPHKVNPIDFENAEGNFGIANAILGHLAEKLPISRLQRDLTDSTVSRNLGVPMGHTLIGLKSVQRGFGKLLLNPAALKADLDANWAVVTEGIQTILRRAGYPNPYEALKSLTRTHTGIDAAALATFISGLAVSEGVKAELRQLRPDTYTGCDLF